MSCAVCNRRGGISSPGCCEIVEASDAVVTVGCVWTDMATLGWSTLIKPEKVSACAAAYRSLLVLLRMSV